MSTTLPRQIVTMSMCSGYFFLLSRVSSCMATKTVQAGKKAPRLSESQFHINNTAYGNKALERWTEKGQITDDDAKLIDNYLTSRRADKHLSQGRVNKIVFTLLAWRRIVKPFRENSLNEIHKGIGLLMDSDYSKNFVYDCVTIIKPFYTWLIEQGFLLFPLSDFPKLEKNFREAKQDKKPLSDREQRTKLEEASLMAIRNIKRPKPDLMTKTRADLLTEDEIKKMVEACESSRDRCILMMLYDGGFRIGEIGKLTWGQVAFDQYGATVNVDEKTGKPRYIRLLSASPYIARWKDDYPFDPSGDNLVFISRQKKPITYNAMYRQLRRIAERAEIKTKVHPHIFRHTRITNLMEKNIPESIIKKMMWGSLTSDMLATYGHLVSTSTDDALLEAAGIKRTERIEDNALAPRQCPMCHLINGPTQKFCGNCGTSLTEEAQASLKATKARAHSDPIYAELMARIERMETELGKNP
jgi:integrase/recombinase XerD